MPIARVCVFCGSSPGARPRYTEVAEGLGRLLARRGLGLVYGGGDVGLMGTVADAVLAGGGEVIGVIPESLVQAEVAHRGVTDLQIVPGMFERKQRMLDQADAFVTMPGGVGSLDELFEVLTWVQLGLLDKPCGLLDIDDYYAPLLAMLDRAVDERFLKPHHRALLVRDTDAGRLLDALETWERPPLGKWLDR